MPCVFEGIIMAKKTKKTSLGKIGRVERERRYNAIIQYSLISIVVFVFVILVGGSIWESTIKPNQPVAIVDGQEILTRDFQAQVRYVRGTLISQYQYYSNLYSYFSSLSLNPSETQNLQNVLIQLQFQLDTPGLLGPSIIEGMIDDVIIRNEAENRGIVVTQAEIDEAFQAEFGFYPDGLPTPTVSPTLAPTSTLSETQLALITLTPTASPTPLATATQAALNTFQPTSPSAHMPTASIDPGSTESATPFATATPFPTPEPTEYTQEQYDTNRDSYLDFIGISLEQNRRIIEARLYRQKLRDSITADLPAEREQVWLRQVQFEDQETAAEFVSRLNDEEWNQLAAEFFPEDPYVSQSLGDYGWVNLDDLIPSLSEVASELPVGVVSSPIESENGWFVIQLLGHETRPLSPNDFENYKEQVFADWLTETRESYQVEKMEYWSNRVPDDPRLPPAQPQGGIPGF